jgi:hypothetical protein
MGSLLGMADRPRSRGFRPALCNEGTTGHCLVRGFMLAGLRGCGVGVLSLSAILSICIGDGYGYEEDGWQEGCGEEDGG